MNINRQKIMRLTEDTKPCYLHGRLALRGGASSHSTVTDPQRMFNTYFGGLAVACCATRILSRSKTQDQQKPKSEGFLSLQRRFLAVFWIWKLADWLHGPYFYEVYASKSPGGQPLGQDGIARMFLCGFASSMFFGTFAGSLIDAVGRKRGCMAFAFMYTLSALSTRSNSLPLLIAGRILGGTVSLLIFLYGLINTMSTRELGSQALAVRPKT
jgi:hypothetical protein